MKIVAGTYDGGLVGWESDLVADPSGLTLQLSYAFGAHDGSVRAIALDRASGNTLATGGVDEIIRIFSLKKHREVGSLLEHKAAISTIEFFHGTHMLSGSQDGQLCVWRTSDWLCLDVMRGHKAAVNSISVHPTGRLALSVGQDCALFMWDLTKGKPIYAAKLPSAPQRVQWCGAGAYFIVAFESSIDVHSGTSGKRIATCEQGGGGATSAAAAKICDVEVVSDPASSDDASHAVCGHEGGDISVWAIPSGALVRRFASGHAKRVRCVTYCDGLTSPVPSGAAAAAACAAAAAGPDSGAATAAARDAASRPTEGLNPLSKLAAAAKVQTRLPLPGPYVVTADSGGSVCIWSVATIVAPAAAAASGGGGDGAPRALATLTAAAGSRITCLAATEFSAPPALQSSAAAGSGAHKVVAPVVAARGVAAKGSGGGKKKRYAVAATEAPAAVVGVKRPRPAAAGPASSSSSAGESGARATPAAAVAAVRAASPGGGVVVASKKARHLLQARGGPAATVTSAEKKKVRFG